MKNKKELPPVIPPKDIIVGDAGAPVKIVMFGDYESDECRKANEVIKELLKIYAGTINFTFRHFPLTRVHQKAHKAAEAAIGAAQEGKFWEMHQKIFQNRHNLGMISLKSYAREVGVTDKKFLDNLINSYYGWFVQDDLKDGINRGITEIPVLYINDVRLEEKTPTLKNMRKEIDQALADVAPVKKRA